MPWKPTCFDCTLADIDPGDPGCHTLSNGDPGWPGSPACVEGCPRFNDYDGEDPFETLDPLTCPLFKPRMVEMCQVCKAPINQPAYSFPGFVSGEWEAVPVCSHKCAINLYLKDNIHRWHGEIRDWKLRTGQLEEYQLWYCPECQIELQPFTDDTSWWISDNGRLYCHCDHCEQEVEPHETYILLPHKMSYSEAISRAR